MKKIILGAGLIFIGTTTFAQGLDSIIVEKYYVSNAADATGSLGATAGTLPAGSVTYRVFADLKANYKLQAVYGDANHIVKINTATTFFNSEDRGATTPHGIGSAYMNDNSNALDSWVSMGGAATGQLGVLKSEDDGVANLLFPHVPTSMLTNTTTATGIPLVTQDGMVAGTLGTITLAGFSTELDVLDATSQAGNSIELNNHAISVAGGVSGPTVNNRILIGQFTTDGTFHFELNIQIANGGTVEQYVSSSPTGGELTDATLTYTSSAITSPSNVLPTVSIIAPITAATYSVGATVAIVATASDSDGTIDSVQFLVDGVRIGKDATSPYSRNYVSTVGTHTLTAIAFDNDGGQTTSSAVIITSLVTGINEINSTENTVSVYPNPTSDMLTIEINASTQTGSYAIYDVLGNLIFNKKLASGTGKYMEQLDMSSFTKGQYILALTLDGVVSTKKIIVN